MTLQKLGWVLAAGIAGAMFAAGFQVKAEKVGVVDIQYVFQNSDLTHNKQDELKNMGQARSDILQFVHTYRTIKPDQADRFKALSLKGILTPAETTELQKLKADVVAQDQSYKALQTKANPTQEEVTRLQTTSTQVQNMAGTEQLWAQQFDQDIRDRQDKLRQEVLGKVQDSVEEIGKKQGFSLVFVKDVAPYAANDLTADVLKVMNAKK